MNANLQMVAEFIRTWKPTFPVGMIDTTFAFNYAQVTAQMRPSVPFLLFIDKKGTIRSQYFGEDPFFQPESALGARIRAEIDKLIKEGSAPAAPAKKAPSAPKKK